MAPGDRQVVALFGRKPSAPRAHRRVRVVVDLAAGHHRSPLVEQLHERADESRLALPALTQQYQVMPGEQRPLHLGQDGFSEPHDARKPVVAGAQPGEQVVAQLLLHRAVDVAGLA